jgi:hypothetical protein
MQTRGEGGYLLKRKRKHLHEFDGVWQQQAVENSVLHHIAIVERLNIALNGSGNI